MIKIMRRHIIKHRCHFDRTYIITRNKFNVSSLFLQNINKEMNVDYKLSAIKYACIKILSLIFKLAQLTFRGEL